MKFIFSASVVFSLLLQSGVSFGAENTFDYPELSVVPRASERLESEAAWEKQQGWKVHLPLLVPATMTAAAGLVELLGGTKADEPLKNNQGAKYAPYIGLGVGLAWWGVTLGILNNLDFYEDGLAEVAKLPAKTQREQLLRERRAEEAIVRAGRLANRLKWISVVTNLGASGFMLASAKDESFPLYFAAASAVTAFTPLFFTHRWESTENLQRDYKKRIYAPIASVGPALLSDPTGRAFLPGLRLSYQF